MILRRRAVPLLAQRGSAVVMALGIMLVVVATVVAVLGYTTANEGSAVQSKSAQAAYGLAEAGLAEALSALAGAADPLDPAVVPATTETFAGGTATYSGELVDGTWTITSTGAVGNPTGGASITRTLTRTVQIGVGDAWETIYVASPTVCTEFASITLPVPFATPGCVTLTGSTVNPARLTGERVAIGGDVTLDAGASIGAPGSPVERADIAGSCTWGAQSPHAPCSATDHVYANAIGVAAGAVKPVADFAGRYADASLGPLHACASGSLPAGATFDDDGIPNASAPPVDLTPAGASYSCRAAGGSELSWNAGTHVLSIAGVVYFDGDVEASDAGALVNYQGRGVVYASGAWRNRELICAGGDGSRNCSTDPHTWDPSHDLLAVVAGGFTAPSSADVSVHSPGAGFQGVLYGEHRCSVADAVVVSGPLVCGELAIAPAEPAFFVWPPLGPLLAGLPAAPGSPNKLLLGPQSG